MKSLTTTTFIACLLSLASLCSAQSTRIIINGQPTNLHTDWSFVAVAPDASAPNAFIALMPLSAISNWASFEAVQSMDLSYGAGNWLRCGMMATDWAYLSGDACAHVAGSNGGTPYAAPLSQLTSSFDTGPYTGAVGNANFPIPSASLFVGGVTPVNYITGLGGGEWDFERWQLRTRGFFPNDLWNGCAPSNNVTPNFSGFPAARFTFSFF